MWENGEEKVEEVLPTGYIPLSEGNIQCTLCPHACHLVPGEMGLCHCRNNQEGRLGVLNHGWLRAMALEPLQRTGFRHFYPQSNIVRLGSFGCPLTCDYCAFPQLRRMGGSGKEIQPEEVRDLAAALRSKDCCGVLYGYGEPLMWYEFILACAPLIKKLGLANAIETSGYMNREPLETLLPFLDAWNIDVGYLGLWDLRRMTSERTLDRVVASGRHVEVTAHLHAGDWRAPQHAEAFAKKIAQYWGEVIPLHLIEEAPAWNLPLQPAEQPFRQAKDAALAYLHHVDSRSRYHRDKD